MVPSFAMGLVKFKLLAWLLATMKRLSLPLFWNGARVPPVHAVAQPEVRYAINSITNSELLIVFGPPVGFGLGPARKTSSLSTLATCVTGATASNENVITGSVKFCVTTNLFR